MPEQVTILGDGAMATVCSILLIQGGHGVTIWGAFEQTKLLPGARVPQNVRLTANDADCFRGCTMILSAIPTQFIRSTWKRLLPYVPKDVPIVSVAKGIENDTLLRPTQAIADVLGGFKVAGSGFSMEGAAASGHWGLAALSGPNIAAELARYLP